MIRAKIIAAVAVAVLLVACEDRPGADRALRDAGFHPIQVGGYGYFDCSEDDVYRTRFRALSPDSSRMVNGCVCRGFFKGHTIRLD